MNVASKELCKELYELSGWGSKLAVADNTDYLWEDGELIHRASQIKNLKGIVPAYDLGYMRKMVYEHTPSNMVDVVESNFSKALFLGEDATAKFVIGLFKQGILKPEERK